MLPVGQNNLLSLEIFVCSQGIFVLYYISSFFDLLSDVENHLGIACLGIWRHIVCTSGPRDCRSQLARRTPHTLDIVFLCSP